MLVKFSSGGGGGSILWGLSSPTGKAYGNLDDMLSRFFMLCIKKRFDTFSCVFGSILININNCCNTSGCFKLLLLWCAVVFVGMR